MKSMDLNRSYPRDALYSLKSSASFLCVISEAPSRSIEVTIRPPHLQREDPKHRTHMETIWALVNTSRRYVKKMTVFLSHFGDVLSFRITRVGEAKENATLTEYLEGLTCGAKRATALVRQIFAFSCKGGGERKPIELWPIATEALRLLRGRPAAAIEFQAPLVRDIAVVLADTEIHQILMNLGINAAHAMLPQGGHLTVKLENCQIGAKAAAANGELRAGHYALFTVGDNGHGMDPETLARIFEPLFTTKAPGAGTGLGLTVVNDIVKSYRGVITIRSRRGEGTIFQVYLPGHLVYSE
jgi:signal transduction histidine kinase